MPTPSITRQAFLRLGACAALTLLAGCAAPPPPPPPPTTVALTLTGAAAMNGGNPARVQVLYLASSAKFQTTDYFALAKDPAAALGPDLVAVDEYLVSPGKAATDAKTFDRPVTHVAVVVGFRDIASASWRAVAPIAANAANPVAATISGASVTLKSGS